MEHFNAENAYWNDEKKEIKYQISEGSEIDQMCGQWHSKICGLGNIFDKEQIETALKNVYKYNFKTSMRDIANTWRVFSLNDESGAIICDYPEGTEKPAIPISYNSETMTGFEYQLAGLMISEGRIKEGLNIVKAIRERYNGKNRNPWNEFECGSNYARSMASYALIPIFSGFIFDLPNKLIGFNPINNKKDFKCIWSLDSGWGNFIIKGKSIKIIIIDGFLEIDKISLKFISSVSKVIIDGKANDFNFSQGLIKIKNQKITKNIIVFE